MHQTWLLTLIPLISAFDHNDDQPPYPYEEAIDNGTYGYYPTWSFVTEPDISAPKMNWLQWDSQCNDGMYYFLTPKGWGLSRPGPMILDWKGDLVWSQHFANEWGGQAYDFMVQHYQGLEVLTFWTGDDTVRGHGSGSYAMLDSAYELVHRVDAANDLTADLHEFLLTPDGTALMTVYQKYEHDLSDWRTFDATADPNDVNPGWIWDCVLQEISVDTRDVIFEWRASEYIDINDTYHLLRQAGNHEDPFDWFHMNSIRKDELGNYLVSARYTHSVTYIDGKTGDMIWTLGGKSNMFMDLSDGFAINFAWQHDAKFVEADAFPETYEPPPEQLDYETRLLSLFDNTAEDQNYVYGMDYSRGLLLEITFPTPGYESSPQADNSHVRDISQIQKLAAASQHTAPTPDPHPNLPYPTYGTDILQDPSINARKILQTNSSNPSHTVRLIKSFSNPSGVRSSSQGSMQILPPTSTANSSNAEGARVLVGYGLNAVFTTFDANGSVLCDAHFGAVTSWERGDIQSYRAYKFPWVGRPEYQPRLVVPADGDRAFVSWNGATEVATWVLQFTEDEDGDEEGGGTDDESGSDSKASWTELARKPKYGFETFFDLPKTLSATGKEARFRVLALDATGEVLDYGISDPVTKDLPDPVPEASEQSTARRFSSPSPNTFLLGCFFGVLCLLTLYEVYRRYLCWRVGKPAAGAVRWRRASGYKLLGDV